MTGYVETQELYHLGYWLHECLDAPGVTPREGSLRKVADALIKSAERIDQLLELAYPYDDILDRY